MNIERVELSEFKPREKKPYLKGKIFFDGKSVDVLLFQSNKYPDSFNITADFYNEINKDKGVTEFSKYFSEVTMSFGKEYFAYKTIGDDTRKYFNFYKSYKLISRDKNEINF